MMQRKMGENGRGVGARLPTLTHMSTTRRPKSRARWKGKRGKNLRKPPPYTRLARFWAGCCGSALALAASALGIAEEDGATAAARSLLLGLPVAASFAEDDDALGVGEDDGPESAAGGAAEDNAARGFLLGFTAAFAEEDDALGAEEDDGPAVGAADDAARGFLLGFTVAFAEDDDALLGAEEDDGPESAAGGAAEDDAARCILRGLPCTAGTKAEVRPPTWTKDTAPKEVAASLAFPQRT